MAQTKLGGSQAYTPIQKRYVQPTQTNTNTDLADAVKGVSNLLTNFAVGKKKEQIAHTAEDKLRLVKKASQESNDIDLAMEGGSYDNKLNEQVVKWRDGGLSDTQIRNNARNYKYDKAIEDWDLTNPENSTDEAQNAYFDTLTQLEDKKLLPIVQADRKKVITDVRDEMQFNFINGTDDYKTKLKNTYDATKQYRNDITEDEIEGRLIQIAIENGDEDELKDLKNNDGIPITQTVKGKEIYDEAILQRDIKDKNDEAKADKDKLKNQEETTENYYRQLVADPDSAQKTLLQAKQQFLKDEISFSQYQNILKQGTAMFPSNDADFSDVDDPQVFSDLKAEAIAGTLSQEKLISMKQFIRAESFRTLSSEALKNGGTEGYGKEGYNIQVNADKSWVKANSGLSILEDVSASLTSKNVAVEKAGIMQEYIDQRRIEYLEVNGELPPLEVVEQYRKDALDKAQRETRAEVSDGFKIDDSLDYESLNNNLNEAKKRGFTEATWFSTLTPNQQAEYYKGYEAKQKELKQNTYGTRPDGTPKGKGWLGEITSSDGSTVSTELTIGISVNGNDIDIPLLVPTLTQEEAQYLADGGAPTQEIVNKAVKHASDRMRQGKSPYASDEEIEVLETERVKEVSQASNLEGVTPNETTTLENTVNQLLQEANQNKSFFDPDNLLGKLTNVVKGLFNGNPNNQAEDIMETPSFQGADVGQSALDTRGSNNVIEEEEEEETQWHDSLTDKQMDDIWNSLSDEDRRKSGIWEKFNNAPRPKEEENAIEKFNNAPRPKEEENAIEEVNDDRIHKHLLDREGYRDKPYKDSLGKWTAGVGHLMSAEDLKKYPEGTKIPQEQIDTWLQEDTAKAKEASVKQAEELNITDPQFIEALTSVNFQLGTKWHEKFPTAYKHLKNKTNLEGAIAEIKYTKEGSGVESDWAKQTPIRVEDFVEAIENLK